MPWRRNGDRRTLTRSTEPDRREADPPERRCEPDDKDRQLEEESASMREFLDQQHRRLREASHHS